MGEDASPISAVRMLLSQKPLSRSSLQTLSILKQMLRYKRSHLSILPIYLVIGILNLSYNVMAQAESPPELNRLEYFSGKWRCQQPAAPETPSGIFVWTVKKDLNDFWYLGNAKETQSPNDGKPIDSREFLGYDAASQKLVRSVVVGNGNFFNLTATDWQDGILIWEGTVIDKGELIPLRQEIIRDSQDKFTATYFIPDDNGNWQPVVNETCDRLFCEFCLNPQNYHDLNSKMSGLKRLKKLVNI